jgi:hypothetical protein
VSLPSPNFTFQWRCELFLTTFLLICDSYTGGFAVTYIVCTHIVPRGWLMSCIVSLLPHGAISFLIHSLCYCFLQSLWVSVTRDKKVLTNTIPIFQKKENRSS